MKYADLSPLAQSLLETLKELESVTRLTAKEMAYESCGDIGILIDRRIAYRAVYDYLTNQQ